MQWTDQNERLAGNLALCRFHSKHVALRMCWFFQLNSYSSAAATVEIKAIEEGVFGERYSAAE
jgi:hypothetical protein